MEEAFAYWRTDSGYKNINNYFSILIHGISKYYTLPYNLELEKAKRYAEIIQANMVPGTSYEVFFRGDREIAGHYNHRLEGFISLTENYGQALAFVDNCCVYSVTVDPRIRRIKTGIEYETIVEPGCYWKNLGLSGKIHNVILYPPNWIPDGDYPWYGDIDYSKMATKIYENLRKDLEGFLDLDQELFLINTRRANIPDNIALNIWKSKNK